MRIYYSAILLLALAACSSVPPEPGMKLGKPYEVDGTTYYPKYDPEYDKTGDASWYGPGFHGKYTASGEIFNQNDLTAAHPTLPMPSLVRVTNLSTGKSLIVRINDRGPFKSHRIIDLSKESAHELGIRSIAKVRVQYLKEETQVYLASLQRGGERTIDMAQYNKDAENAASKESEPEVAEAEPSSQIEENIDASSHAGQTVDDAAPVMTVKADELEPPAEKKKHTGGLIKEAAAEDNVMPSPVNEDPPGFDPPLSKTAAVPAAALAQWKSPSAPVASADGYLIQAGSFAAEENARKLASKLSTVASLYVDKLDAGEKSLWRVRLGPFKNRELADAALVRVRAAGVPDARIVRL